MKKYIVILLLFHFSFSHAQQVDLVNEIFDDSLTSDWVHFSGWAASSPQWAVDSGALKNVSGPFFGPTSDWVFLPAIDFTSVSDPFLEFDLAMAVIDTNIQFSVLYSRDSTFNLLWDGSAWIADSSWHLISTYGSSTSGAANIISVDTTSDTGWKPLITDYQTISVNLSELKDDSNVRIIFGSDCKNYWATGIWYIDNVKIFGNTSTRIFEHSESSSFQLFPNPTNAVVRFIPSKYTKNATLKITAITGAILLEKLIDSAIEEIDLSSYNAGIYFVHYIYDKRTSIKKLIIH